jgi:hypothetical protein
MTTVSMEKLVWSIISETTEGAVTKSIGSARAAKATGSATTIENVADILEREPKRDGGLAFPR